jgi:hypothetical protein
MFVCIFHHCPIAPTTILGICHGLASKAEKIFMVQESVSKVGKTANEIKKFTFWHEWEKSVS